MSNENLEQFLGHEIPKEILSQLGILGKIQFPLKHTEVSAISTSSQDESLIDKTEEQELKGLTDHVKDMENTLEQIEDMIDNLTKDMNIPPANSLIASAASKLNNDGGSNITQETLDKALAIMDYLPTLVGLGDPILGALTGNSKIDGPWLKCNEITAGLASTFKTFSNEIDAADPIKNQTDKMIEEFNIKQSAMLQEILNMFWWNMVWAKYLIDPVLINPIRVLISPIDGLIVFFKSFPFKKRDPTTGPLNKLLNKLRIILLCDIPRRSYTRYKPPEDLKCPPKTPCSKKNLQDPENAKGAQTLSEVGAKISSLISDDCITEEELLKNMNSFDPKTLGMSPECAQAAKVVLDAVISNALTAPSTTFLTGLRNKIVGV